MSVEAATAVTLVRSQSQESVHMLFVADGLPAQQQQNRAKDGREQ